jgi:copper(I)-binding protein
MKIYLFLTALLLVVTGLATQCGPAPAALQQSSDPDIVIMEPYARAAIPNGAVFMKLMNAGGADDRLISAQTEVANAVELHESKMDENGVMRMSPVPNIPVPAGGSATLQPGGLHVMLIGLNRELAIGDKFSLTLNFEKSGPRTLEVEVRDSMMSQMGHGEMEGMEQKQE